MGGSTAMHYAVHSSHQEIVEILFENGFESIDKTGQSPLWDCEELSPLELGERYKRKIDLLVNTLSSNADTARARRAARLREEEEKKRREQKTTETPDPSPTPAAASATPEATPTATPEATPIATPEATPATNTAAAE